MNNPPDNAQTEAALRAENDHLRASLANGPGPCPYCALPKEQWQECRRGFPGCARGDDAMLCPHVGAALANDDEVKRLREALELACDTLNAYMNLPIEANAAGIEQEKDDLAIMDKVRAALGLKPWLEAMGIELKAKD